MKQGMVDEPGLGQEMYEAAKNGDEMPEADVELSDDDSPVVKRIKELIIEMTAYKASDRPSAQHVLSVLTELHSHAIDATGMTSQQANSVDPSLRLLQALNDQEQAAIDDCVADDDVKDWIDNCVDYSQLKSPADALNAVEYMTSLTYASRFNGVSIVRQLVGVGADVTATDSRGHTPLHRACESNVDVSAKVNFLLQCNASVVNIPNFHNYTPLHASQRN